MGWVSFFAKMFQIFVSAAQSKKWHCLGFSGVRRAKFFQHISSKWIIWDGMTGHGLTGIHFLSQGQTLTTDYCINNKLEKEVEPVLHRKNVNETTDKKNCSVPIATWRSSKTGRQHTQPRPPRHGAKKNLPNFIEKTFPRYQPCGESLEHNGWRCL